jgi:GNAT superfamily N-acetyltransferase
VTDLRILTGAALDARLDDLAALRIQVFRDWPYLYEGTLAYERSYLAPYRTTPGAIVVGAFDGDRLIGAATGTPMEGHAAEFATALHGFPTPLNHIFYCAESVLLPAYRGQGFGHRFFDLRESHARSLGRSHVAFCAVVRSDTHPARAAAPRDNATFWAGRGYAPLPGAIAQFEWRDIGAPTATYKPLQFWMRKL